MVCVRGPRCVCLACVSVEHKPIFGMCPVCYLSVKVQAGAVCCLLFI